jgi:hypothetical protein
LDIVSGAQLAQATHGVSRQTQPLVAWHVALSICVQFLKPMSSGPQGLMQDV